MYVQHFGLKKRPFRANATGTDVFVGPQTVTAIAGLKTALQGNDSVVVVYGPVGAGKSTLVGRALEAIGEDRIVVRISRMRLNSDDVLEHLLAELGADDIPTGTIRKFTAFRKRLKNLEQSQTRVFVVVEDAPRLGVDTLAELEAVTAEDAGESDGASLVLMGDEHIDEVLGASALARLSQRTHQKHLLAPLCTAELRGYLRHCFRLAGSDFEQIFQPEAPDLLHHLTKGVMRTTNKLVESVLAAAAVQNLTQVPSDLIARVAAKEFGLSADGFTMPAPAAAAPAATAPAVEPPVVPEMAPEPEPEPEPVFEAEPVEAPEPAAEEDQPEPVVVFAEESPEDAEKDIPELIQDTLPDLEVLAPELASAMPEVEPEIPELEPVVAEPEPVLEAEPEPVLEAEPEPVFEAEPEPVPEPETEDVPELSLAEDAATPDSDGDDVAAWDRDPTFAELKPDLEALEKAMNIAQGGDSEAEPPVLEPEPEPEPVAENPVAEEIPEITLDNAISGHIQSNLIDEPGQISPTASDSAATSNSDVPEVKIPKKSSKKADAEIEQIAAELAKAKSIEDVDDKLAETLFGEELNLVAAQVVANPPSSESANEEINGVVAEGQVVAQGSAAVDVSSEPSVEVTLGARDEDDDFDPLSASQRLKTVRALNADLHPSLREPEEPAANEPEKPVDSVDSIEDQINTSMTQTLKALNIRPPLSEDEPAVDPASDDDDDEESKGGFFSRFRRS